MRAQTRVHTYACVLGGRTGSPTRPRARLMEETRSGCLRNSNGKRAPGRAHAHARKGWCQHIHMSAPGNRNMENRSCLRYIETRTEADQVSPVQIGKAVSSSYHKSKPGCALYHRDQDARPAGLCLYTRTPSRQGHRKQGWQGIRCLHGSKAGKDGCA